MLAHALFIAGDERDPPEEGVILGGVEAASHRPAIHLARLIEPSEPLERARQVRVGGGHVRVETHGLARRLQGFRIGPGGPIEVGERVVRPPFRRVGLLPRRRRRDRPIEVARDAPMIEDDDTGLFPRGDPRTQLEGARGGRHHALGVARVQLVAGERLLREREVRIDLHRALKQGRRHRIVATPGLFRPQRVGLQRVQRGGRGLLDGRAELLDGGRRLAQLQPELDRRPAQRGQDLRFTVDHDAFAHQLAAARAAGRDQADGVTVAERRDRAGDHDGDSPAHGDLLRDQRCQGLVGRTRHQAQRLPHAGLGDDADERRLLQLHDQRFSERAIEGRIPRGVAERRNQHRLLPRQLGGPRPHQARNERVRRGRDERGRGDGRGDPRPSRSE